MRDGANGDRGRYGSHAGRDTQVCRVALGCLGFLFAYGTHGLAVHVTLQPFTTCEGR